MPIQCAERKREDKNEREGKKVAGERLPRQASVLSVFRRVYPESAASFGALGEPDCLGNRITRTTISVESCAAASGFPIRDGEIGSAKGKGGLKNAFDKVERVLGIKRATESHRCRTHCDGVKSKTKPNRKAELRTLEIQKERSKKERNIA